MSDMMHSIGALIALMVTMVLLLGGILVSVRVIGGRASTRTTIADQLRGSPGKSGRFEARRSCPQHSAMARARMLSATGRRLFTSRRVLLDHAKLGRSSACPRVRKRNPQRDARSPEVMSPVERPVRPARWRVHQWGQQRDMACVQAPRSVREGAHLQRPPCLLLASPLSPDCLPKSACLTENH